MFKFFANIFGYVLNFIYGMIGNFGISIIIFTILLRLLLLPMSIKQQKTMKKSAKIQAKMKELQDKYSNDPVRLNQEVMNLYASEKMSPLSGCLSSILQIVVVIAVFFVVSSPLTYMKKIPEAKINEYKEVISEEIKDNKNYVEISIIKHLAKTEDAVNINMNFLGLDLSDIPSKDYSDIRVFIIPVLYIITSIASTKLTMASTNKKEEEITATKEDKQLVKTEEKNDEMEMVEAMNKNMKYMMPMMTVMVALIAPLGLALYWFVSNLIMIIERLLMKKFIKEEE